MVKKVLLAVLAATFFGPMTANADFISGAIAFTGDWVPTGGTGIADATGISFTSDLEVQGASGDYAVIPTDGSVPATFKDFLFDPFTSNNPLWLVTYDGVTYAFALDTIVIDLQNATQLNLSGTGTLVATGFDNTAGTWVFTGNQFTFSGVSVPEPGTLALLGLGLAGLGFAARKKAKLAVLAH